MTQAQTVQPDTRPMPLCWSSGATALFAPSVCAGRVTNLHRGHIVRWAWERAEFKDINSYNV